jgi:Obg family GTPase CgtA-like protein
MSGQGWVISGTEIEAVVRRFDPTNAEAVAYLQHHFRGFGVNKLLKRAGAVTGEEVHIGDAVFDYFDDTAPVADIAAQDDAERAGRRYLEEESELTDDNDSVSAQEPAAPTREDADQ